MVNEKSTAYLTVEFWDKNGQAEAPSDVTWEAHDVRTGTELQAATALTPGTSIEIEIPGSVNAMISPKARKETKRVTVRATYGDGSTINDQFDYEVRNLGQVS